MNLKRPRKRSRLRMDMTPMIDVVLQLIIFFMYTSQFTSMTRTPLDLPKEAGDQSEAVEQTSIVVDVRADGQLIVEGQEVDLARVADMVLVEIDRAGGSPAATDLLIRADRSAPAAYVNRLATELAALGVRSWKLATATETPR